MCKMKPNSDSLRENCQQSRNNLMDGNYVFVVKRLMQDIGCRTQSEIKLKTILCGSENSSA